MRVALVGSGPSLQDAGLGAEIDSHDAVMRLYDCDWHAPADHGVKWTHGLIPGPWSKRNFSDLGNLPCGWYSYHFGIPHKSLPEGVINFDVSHWNTTGRSYATPQFRVTRGFAMFVAATMIEGASIIDAYGFDSMSSGASKGYKYHPGYIIIPKGYDPRPLHDAGAERRMVEDLRQLSGIQINFIPEIAMTTLEDAETVTVRHRDTLVVQLTRRLPPEARQSIQADLEASVPKGTKVKILPPGVTLVGAVRDERA